MFSIYSRPVLLQLLPFSSRVEWTKMLRCGCESSARKPWPMLISEIDFWPLSPSALLLVHFDFFSLSIFSGDSSFSLKEIIRKKNGDTAVAMCAPNNDARSLPLIIRNTRRAFPLGFASLVIPSDYIIAQFDGKKDHETWPAGEKVTSASFVEELFSSTDTVFLSCARKFL